MKKRKPTLDDYIGAIICKDEGMPYLDVLRTFELTPNQFAYAIIRNLDSHIRLIEGKPRQILEAIESSPTRKAELFNMGKQCLKEQYDRIHGRIPGETQDNFYQGLSYHTDNIKTIIHYALTSNYPKLGSSERKVVIDELNNLPSDLTNTLQRIKIRRLKTLKAGKLTNISSLEIFDYFDKEYQRNTEDNSLFDLNKELHAHRWEIGGKAPQSYWKNKSNVEEAVYHLLTENQPKLLSNDRDEVIKQIKDWPNKLAEYFDKFKLTSIMHTALNGSPIRILEVFDRVYQRKTGNKSIFDLNQKEHLHRWDVAGHAPIDYWQDKSKVEEAIYHRLNEDNPIMVSNNRSKIVECINSFPQNLTEYFYSIGFSGLIMTAFENEKRGSPLAILEVFDKVYQRETKDVSLFDLNQKEHLHKWKVAGHVSNYYWKNSKNVDEAVYHILTETNPNLLCSDKSIIIQTIKAFPPNLSDYFEDLGLGSVMQFAFEGSLGSPLKVLKVFDKVYQNKTEDTSLFDNTQKYYLKLSGKNRIIRE